MANHKKAECFTASSFPSSLLRGSPKCGYNSEPKPTKNSPHYCGQNQYSLQRVFASKTSIRQNLSRAREYAPPPRHVRFCQPADHQAYPRQLLVEQATVVRLKTERLKPQIVCSSDSCSPHSKQATGRCLPRQHQR